MTSNQVESYNGFKEFLRNLCVHGQACGYDHVLHDIAVGIGRLLSEPNTRHIYASKMTVVKSDCGGLIITLYVRHRRELKRATLNTMFPVDYPAPNMEVVFDNGVCLFDQFVFELVETYKWLNRNLVKPASMQAWLIGMNTLLDIAALPPSENALPNSGDINLNTQRLYSPHYCVLTDAIKRDHITIIDYALNGFTRNSTEEFYPPHLWHKDNESHDTKAYYYSMIVSLTLGVMGVFTASHS